MTDPSLHEVYKAIGMLTAEVTGLRRDIQQAETRAQDSTRRADEHRAVVHRRVDDLIEEVGEVKVDMATVKVDMATMRTDVADTKSVTDDVKRWKLMGIGALFVTGLAASAVASAITYFWSDLLRLLRGP
jgi:cell division GTPase FtsZ